MSSSSSSAAADEDQQKLKQADYGTWFREKVDGVAKEEMLKAVDAFGKTASNKKWYKKAILEAARKFGARPHSLAHPPVPLAPVIVPTSSCVCSRAGTSQADSG